MHAVVSVPKLRRLRALRQRKMWSLADLAERSGVAENTISRIENGREARYSTARKLAEALGIEPYELVGDPDR